MMNGKPSDTKAQETQSNSERKPANPSPVLSSAGQDSDQKHAAQKTENRQKAQHSERETGLNVWLIRQMHEHASDWVNVFLAAAIVYFTWSSGQQSDRIMKAAEDNASAARSFSQSAASISKDIRSAKEDFGRIAESSKKSIEATQNAMQLDERAWVGIKQIRKLTFEAGKPITVQVALVNTGKTFALDSTTLLTIIATDAPLDVEHFAKSRDRPKFSTIPSRTTLFPNTDFFVNVSTSRKLTEDELKGINDDRTMVVYVFGEVRYKDIFGKPHTTKFCSYYEPLANMFASCHQYNFAN